MDGSEGPRPSYDKPSVLPPSYSFTLIFGFGSYPIRGLLFPHSADKKAVFVIFAGSLRVRSTHQHEHRTRKMNAWELILLILCRCIDDQMTGVAINLMHSHPNADRLRSHSV